MGRAKCRRGGGGDKGDQLPDRVDSAQQTKKDESANGGDEDSEVPATQRAKVRGREKKDGGGGVEKRSESKGGELSERAVEEVRGRCGAEEEGVVEAEEAET